MILHRFMSEVEFAKLMRGETLHNHRLVCEQLYAQRRFHIQGGEIPDLDFAILVKCYKTQLEIMQERERRVPDYIDRLFQKRYEFHFNKD